MKTYVTNIVGMPTNVTDIRTIVWKLDLIYYVRQALADVGVLWRLLLAFVRALLKSILILLSNPKT